MLEENQIRESPTELAAWSTSGSLPSETTEARIRVLIEIGMKEEAALDGEIARVQELLQSLLKKRIAESDRLGILRRAVSPVKRLPIEVLVQILNINRGRYELTTIPPRSDTQLWRFGHVCSRWRVAMWCAHELWQDVRITVTGFSNMSNEKFAEIKEIVPHILLHTNARFSLSLSGMDLTSRIISLLPTVGKSFRAIDIQNAEDITVSTLLHLPRGTFSSLTSLKLSARLNTNFQIDHQISSLQHTQLTVLTFMGIHIPPQYHPCLPSTLPQSEDLLVAYWESARYNVSHRLP